MIFRPVKNCSSIVDNLFKENKKSPVWRNYTMVGDENLLLDTLYFTSFNIMTHGGR